MTHGTTKMGNKPSDLLTTLAHHDAAISTLGGRMSGVERSLSTLQGEVHTGFVGLGSKLDKIDARPTFNFGDTVRTVLSLAVLFSMVVGGIIWVTTAQQTGLVAKVEKHEAAMERLSERIGWVARVETAKGGR
jgi:hypothetical protein